MSETKDLKRGNQVSRVNNTLGFNNVVACIGSDGRAVALPKSALISCL